MRRIVDAHFHLQDLGRVVYPWLDPESAPPDVFGENFDRLRRSYRIEDYLADVSGLGVIKAVHVENGVAAEDAVAETLWLQSIADRSGFPHAIVAQVALHEPGAARMIEAHAQAKNLRGLRHILNWHADPKLRFAAARDLLASADWRRGFSLLRRYDLSFDLQVYPGQLADAADLARAFPDTPIVLCHLGMPIERGLAWRGRRALLAAVARWRLSRARRIAQRWRRRRDRAWRQRDGVRSGGDEGIPARLHAAQSCAAQPRFCGIAAEERLHHCGGRFQFWRSRRGGARGRAGLRLSDRAVGRRGARAPGRSDMRPSSRRAPRRCGPVCLRASSRVGGSSGRGEPCRGRTRSGGGLSPHTRGVLVEAETGRDHSRSRSDDPS